MPIFRAPNFMEYSSWDERFHCPGRQQHTTSYEITLSPLSESRNNASTKAKRITEAREPGHRLWATFKFLYRSTADLQALGIIQVDKKEEKEEDRKFDERGGKEIPNMYEEREEENGNDEEDDEEDDEEESEDDEGDGEGDEDDEENVKPDESGGEDKVFEEAKQKKGYEIIGTAGIEKPAFQWNFGSLPSTSSSPKGNGVQSSRVQPTHDDVQLMKTGGSVKSMGEFEHAKPSPAHADMEVTGPADGLTTNTNKEMEEKKISDSSRTSGKVQSWPSGTQWSDIKSQVPTFGLTQPIAHTNAGFKSPIVSNQNQHLFVEKAENIASAETRKDMFQGAHEDLTDGEGPPLDFGSDTIGYRPSSAMDTMTAGMDSADRNSLTPDHIATSSRLGVLDSMLADSTSSKTHNIAPYREPDLSTTIQNESIHSEMLNWPDHKRKRGPITSDEKITSPSKKPAHSTQGVHCPSTLPKHLTDTNKQCSSIVPPQPTCEKEDQEVSDARQQQRILQERRDGEIRALDKSKKRYEEWMRVESERKKKQDLEEIFSEVMSFAPSFLGVSPW
jgi:hypothetical protein